MGGSFRAVAEPYAVSDESTGTVCDAWRFLFRMPRSSMLSRFALAFQLPPIRITRIQIAPIQIVPIQIPQIQIPRKYTST